MNIFTNNKRRLLVYFAASLIPIFISGCMSNKGNEEVKKPSTNNSETTEQTTLEKNTSNKESDSTKSNCKAKLADQYNYESGCSPKIGPKNSMIPGVSDPTANDVKTLLENYKNDQITVKDSNPYHIHIKYKMLEAEKEQPGVDDLRAKRILYGIYESFIYTDLERIKLTVTPIIVEDFSDNKGKLLEKEQITLDITRKRAQQIAQKYFGISNLVNLKGGEGNSEFSADKWSPKFSKVYYEGQNRKQMITDLKN